MKTLKELIDFKTAYIYLKSSTYFKHLDLKCKTPVEFDPYFHKHRYTRFYILVNGELITDRYYIYDKPSLNDKFKYENNKWLSIKDYTLIERI